MSPGAGQETGMVRLGPASSATLLLKRSFKDQEKAPGGSFPASPLQDRSTHRISELSGSVSPTNHSLPGVFHSCFSLFAEGAFMLSLMASKLSELPSAAVNQKPGLMNNSVWSRNCNRSWRRPGNLLIVQLLCVLL